MINIGSSCDTGEFACDSLRQWWYSQGKLDYPHADAENLGNGATAK
jgi:hypothetical protein